jgi:NADH:ubiquinone oxidoreductase subunit 5 (subunit L)/multisubunit Na+/H+ antiporter MnhA subunit
MVSYLEWFVPAFPLLGALLNGLGGRWFSRRVQNWIACGSIAGALLALLPMFAGQAIAPGLVGRSKPLPWIEVWSGSWFVEGPLVLRVDALSILVALSIAAGGLLIHVYLSRRPAGEAAHHVPLALLNGTLAALLLLALADNLLTLLLGWSLAGWGAYGLVQDRRKSLAVAVLSLSSDLCLLLAVGAISQTWDGLSVDDLIAMGSDLASLSAVPEAVPFVVTLIVLSAVIRAVQFPFHIWLSHQVGTAPGADAFLYGLFFVPASVFLIARVYPLVMQVSFAPSLLSWWGISSALWMALMALAQPEVRHRVRYVAVGQGGLLLVALGQGQPWVAFSFLPAYMVLQAMVFLAVINMPRFPRSGQDAGAFPATQWAVLFGELALTGVPLLPGFFFSGNLIALAFHGSAGLGVLAALAVLLMAAAAFRTAVQGRRTRGAPAWSSVLFTMAVGGIALGLLNLTSPPLLALFLEPVGGRPTLWPAWWFGVTTCVVGIGAGLGYGLGRSSVRSKRWISRVIQIDRDLYRVSIADPLLAVGEFVVRDLEGNLARWTLGVLARWVLRLPKTKVRSKQ